MSVPTTLGKYQIIREIARSNDIVYEGYDPLMNRRVALKELSAPRGATGPQLDDRVNRFKREAQAVGTLAHPNIMTVYEYGQEADRHFMAMEYLDGHTLRNEIDTKGFLPPENAVHIAQEILKGLGHAHSKGVIHRDIKPDNIQLLSSGEIKITDFGIARLTFQPNLTMDGQVFGTPSYMSPEQVVGKELDQRSDLWSVGVLLYEMITGQKPFAGDSVVSITYAIMNSQPTPPAQATPALRQVIMKALDKTPSMRFANAAEMLKALEDAIKEPDPPALQPQQPYNPWAASAPATYQYPGQPQVHNPYAAPPAAPPAQYPYNPYAQPGPLGAPHVPGALPPGLPTWYPPPPRAPLIKPETKLAITRAILYFLVIGTIVGGILIAISMFANSGDQIDLSGEQANRAAAQPEAISPDMPFDSTPAITARPSPIPTRNREGDFVAVPVESIRETFRRLQRDHTPPDTSDIAEAQNLLTQLGGRDEGLRQEIEAYINGTTGV